MIAIDYQNRKPIYEQIVEKFQKLILKEILPSGSQMPSVRSLAVELSINPNTIQKAYMTLEQNGYIYSIKGRGTFVAESTELKEQKKESFLKKIKELVIEAKELEVLEDECMNMFKNCWKEENSS